MQYMSNNERVKKLNKIRLQQKDEYLVRVKKELKDLDSLKNTQYFKQNPDRKSVVKGKSLDLGGRRIIKKKTKQKKK